MVVGATVTVWNKFAYWETLLLSTPPSWREAPVRTSVQMVTTTKEPRTSDGFANLCYMPWRLGWFFKVLVDLLLLFSVLLLYLLSLWLELRMFDTFLELDNASLCWFLLYGDCMVLSYIVAGRSIWGQGQCNLCQNYTYLTPDQTCRALRGFWWGNDLKFQTK